MPFYEYKPTTDTHCDVCEDGFELLQRLSEDPFTECPKCKSPVKKVISAPNVQSGQAHLLKEDNIESKGFTQYKKIGKGAYEKTAGKGPSHIIDED